MAGKTLVDITKNKVTPLHPGGMYPLEWVLWIGVFVAVYFLYIPQNLMTLLFTIVTFWLITRWLNESTWIRIFIYIVAAIILFTHLQNRTGSGQFDDVSRYKLQAPVIIEK